METLDKAQQFDRLYATPPVYEWELIVNPDHSRTKTTYDLFFCCNLVGVLFLFINFSWLSLIPIVVGSYMCPWYRHLVNAEKTPLLRDKSVWDVLNRRTNHPRDRLHHCKTLGMGWLRYLCVCGNIHWTDGICGGRRRSIDVIYDDKLSFCTI